jgi:hypothetical protein
MAPESQVVHIFEREILPRVGGCRENLVLGEGEDLALRAKAQGIGVPTESLFEGIGCEPDQVERAMDLPRRLSNYMEYSFTLWEYFDRVENPSKVAFGCMVIVLRLLGQFPKGGTRALCHLLGPLGGLFLWFGGQASRERTERVPAVNDGGGH